jgi:hypothetical protein
VNPPHRAAIRAIAVLSLALLSGCGWFSSSSSKSAQGSCPSAVILRALANTAVFGVAAERRPESVAFYGLLSEVNSKCDVSGDTMQLKLDVIVIAERGPASKEANSVDFNYFVAVTGPDQAVLSKKLFPVRIAIAPGEKRSGVTDHIEEAVSLGGRKLGDVNVVLGFQQTPEVVEFYKRFRGR